MSKIVGLNEFYGEAIGERTLIPHREVGVPEVVAEVEVDASRRVGHRGGVVQTVGAAYVYKEGILAPYADGAMRSHHVHIAVYAVHAAVAFLHNVENIDAAPRLFCHNAVYAVG